MIAPSLRTPFFSMARTSVGFTHCVFYDSSLNLTTSPGPLFTVGTVIIHLHICGSIIE